MRDSKLRLLKLEGLSNFYKKKLAEVNWNNSEQVRSERGNKSFRKRAQEKQMKPGCESCKSKSIGDQCKHCWSCGGDNHISYHYSRNPRNQKGNYGGLQPWDRE